MKGYKVGRKQMSRPELNKQPLPYVDATPDENYPIRILQAFLHDAGCDWEVHGLSEEKSKIYDLMNEHQKERRILLSRAIKVLQENR